MRILIQRSILFAISFLVSLSLFSCKEKEGRYFKQEGGIWGTLFHITYKSDSSRTTQITMAFDELNRSVNPFDSLSLISRINRNESFETDSLFRICFSASQRISMLSEGAFDPTCSPLFNAWGFGFKHREQMTQAKVDSLLQIVGYEKMSLQGDRIVKADPRMSLDFASIAKGLGADHVARRLVLSGVSDYLVEVGGEIAFSGLNPQGEPWRVGIDRPSDANRNMSGDLQCILRLSQKGGGLATSGNYRNYYEEGGKRYAHTIDPRTGYPVQTDVLSATVLAESSMIADALATLFMVVGSEKAKELAAKVAGVEFMLICASDDGETSVSSSPGFDAMIVE